MSSEVKDVCWQDQGLCGSDCTLAGVSEAAIRPRIQNKQPLLLLAQEAQQLSMLHLMLMSDCSLLQLSNAAFCISPLPLSGDTGHTLPMYLPSLFLKVLSFQGAFCPF